MSRDTVVRSASQLTRNIIILQGWELGNSHYHRNASMIGTNNTVYHYAKAEDCRFEVRSTNKPLLYNIAGSKK